MKMEVLAVQQQYQSQFNIYGSNKVRDWTSTLTPLMPLSTYGCLDSDNMPASQPQTQTPHPQQPAVSASIPIPYPQNNTTNKMRNSITSKKSKRTAPASSASEELNTSSASKTQARATPSAPAPVPVSVPAPKAPATPASGNGSTSSYQTSTPPHTNLFYCDDLDAAAVQELSLRLLDELRAAKSRHLTCTEVSLPCDLTSRIAAEIIRVSEKEPCGIRGCTIYIEFEDEPNNSRRIATLKLDPEMVSTFEVYLTLRQDHRGWTALLPQFIKSLARTITISPAFTITKHKLYSPDRSSYSYGSSSNSRSTSAAISTPSS